MTDQADIADNQDESETKPVNFQSFVEEAKELVQLVAALTGPDVPPSIDERIMAIVRAFTSRLDFVMLSAVITVGKIPRAVTVAWPTSWETGDATDANGQKEHDKPGVFTSLVQSGVHHYKSSRLQDNR